eukprot:CAMPEP_0198334710 /NCGR_PEP_ID=MMETSP1450-20131203/19806_1 /TAXON_ID=753684 ORGANISM="Madagascaria erythrocladiodes, Strain CCMP3234" /NCGR_SAMPLE_ID=MMETSP1450 /ASSEMBLY_ACC=CAM_ASM_001115 /LENGTH=41 /DNA_ID= /DNA_START= /DNA_END= /DNA_ORIENTATION=
MTPVRARRNVNSIARVMIGRRRARTSRGAAKVELAWVALLN